VAGPRAQVCGALRKAGNSSEFFLGPERQLLPAVAFKQTVFSLEARTPSLEARTPSNQMRCVVAVLVACTPHAAAAAALVARGASDDIHQPFTNELSNVHATLFNVTRDVETVEQSGPSSGPASQLRKHTESALREIEQVLGLGPKPPNRPSSFPACTLDASWCSLGPVTSRRGLRAYGMCGAALRFPRGCHRL
jgi:hypothetical protein